LLTRAFTHREVFPSDLVCHADEPLALHGTPVAGTTLLHLCVEFLEPDVARWLIERGADVNAPAAVDSDGFGGHTALLGRNRSFLFNCGLYIVQVLQDGLFHHALEQKQHRDRQFCNDTLRLGNMRTNQRNAAAAL